VEENRRPADLRVVRFGLIKHLELLALEILGGVLRHWAEEIGREVAELHDLPGVFSETELFANLLAAL